MANLILLIPPFIQCTWPQLAGLQKRPTLEVVRQRVPLDLNANLDAALVLLFAGQYDQTIELTACVPTRDSKIS